MSRRTLLVALLILLLAIAAVLAVGLTTETGLRFAVARLESALPGARVDSAEGRLIGPIRLRGIRYEGPGIEAEVDAVDIRWRPSRLLWGTLSVDGLIVTGMRAHSTSEEAESAGGELAVPQSLELPVDIELAEARLETLEYRSFPDAEVLVVDSLAFQGAWDRRDGIALTHIQAASPLLDVEGNFSLLPRQAYPLEASLRFEARAPDYAPVVGVVQADGNLQALALTVETDSPFRVRAVVDASDVSAGLRVEGHVALDEMELDRVHADWPTASLEAAGDFSGEPGALTVRLDATLTEASAGAITAAFAGSYTPTRIQIDTLQIARAEHPGRLDAKGELVLEGAQPRVDLRAEWEMLQWPLAGAPSFASPKGEFRVQGGLDDYSIHADGRWQGPARTMGGFLVSGAGDRESLSLPTIDLALLGGQVNGSLELGWHERFEFSVRANGRDLNPAEVLPDFPGDLDFDVDGGGSLAGGAWQVRVRELGVNGRLAGRDVALEAAGAYVADSVELGLLHLRAGSTELRGEGRLGAQSDFDWTLDSRDVGAVLPVASGSLRGGGSIRGALHEPRVVVELDGTDLRYQGYAVRLLRLEADVDVAGVAQSHVDLSAAEGTLNDVLLQNLALSAQGLEGSHEFSLDAHTSHGSAELAGRGALEDGGWAFELAKAELTHPSLAPWLLDSPAAGRIGLAESRLSRSCWRSDTSRLCFQGEFGGEGGLLSFQIDDLPMAYLTLPDNSGDVELDGGISGAGDLKWRAGRLTGELGLDTTESRIGIGDEAALQLEPGSLDLHASPDGAAELLVELPIVGGGGLSAAVELSGGSLPFAQRAVSGRLDLDMGELDFLADVHPSVQTLDGELAGHVELSGTAGAPALRGRVALTDGSAALVGPGITLEGVEVVLAGRDSGAVEISAHARSGAGTLRVHGTAGLAGDSAAALSVVGEDFQVLNTPEAEVIVSPNFEVDATTSSVRVSGELLVPRAKIEIDALPESAVQPSNDQIIVLPESETARELGPDVSAEVTVVLGDDVRFDGFGLGVSLAGRITATERPGEPTTATGEIRVVEGSYRAYGQNLDIESGRLVFSGGPIDRPGLDVRAVRYPTDDVTVGVTVRGTLRRPELSLFSDPSMQQSEQLSYLVLGRSLGESTGAESSALNQAALALGMRGGSALADWVGGNAGLDEVSIGSDPGRPASEVSLTVGKYLSPKLFVAYGIGLMNPVSTFRLRYTLSSKWKLVTESSPGQSGGDVFYTIAR